jgi:hypothetical protein
MTLNLYSICLETRPVYSVWPPYYSADSTVLSGLLSIAQPVATEFRFGGNIHVA